jgi:hypothetical protein
MEIGDAISSLIYGQLEVDIHNPTHLEQLEIVRAIVSNPASIKRLKIVGEIHPWVARLLEQVREREPVREQVREPVPSQDSVHLRKT